jgi:oligopeptide/dipeptide ABC transporter ATP-binding protein
MYLGVIVEESTADEIMSHPLHPYTQALLSAAPTLAARQKRNWQRIVLCGDPPNPVNVPPGCRFHPRCPLARDACRHTVPELRLVGAAAHRAACHFAPDETEARGLEIAKARRGG